MTLSPRAHTLVTPARMAPSHRPVASWAPAALVGMAREAWHLLLSFDKNSPARNKKMCALLDERS